MPRNNKKKKCVKVEEETSVEKGPTILTMVTTDGETFNVPMDTFPRRNDLMTIFFAENVDIVEGEVTRPCPVAMDSATMKRILRWCNHYKPNFPKRTTKGDKNLELSEFDAELFNISSPELMQLSSAAWQLKLEGLSDTAIKKLCRVIKGKSPEELRNILQITNDFTPEEEARIKMENLARTAMYD